MSAPDGNSDALVEVEAVHTHYGKSHILDGVSLRVGKGEVVGLLGRNGVGKSTTLKTIMGLVRPSAGRVLLEGRPINGLPPHRMARLGIGYVPEDRRIFRALTVMENLRTGLDRARRRRGRASTRSCKRSTIISRYSPSGGASRAARSRAASSRCSPSRAR